MHGGMSLWVNVHLALLHPVLELKCLHSLLFLFSLVAVPFVCLPVGSSFDAVMCGKSHLFPFLQPSGVLKNLHGIAEF